MTTGTPAAREATAVDGDATTRAGGRRGADRRTARRALVAVAVAGAMAASVGGGWLAARWSASPPSASSIDVGFLRDMSDHHDQAVQLSLLVLGNGEDPALQGFATDTIATQRYEIGLMDARLDDWGHGRGERHRPTMAWMGMPTPLEAMPGMASAEDVARLASRRGREADLLFIELMVAHHQGGIHMAEYAWRRAGTEPVRQLAETIAKVQRVEIRDLARIRQRLDESGE